MYHLFDKLLFYTHKHLTVLCLMISVASNTTSFAELQDIAVQLVEVVQTEQLAQSVGMEITTLNVVEPVPPPKDLTGGVRATNDTGS